MEITITNEQPIKVQAKTISISAKCSDCFSATLLGEDGQILREYDGYVPKFFPGTHYGDYVMLDIDLDTGIIKNWAVPTAEQVEKFIEGDE